MNKPFPNIEIVTLAVYLLGGESRYVDTEDIAIKSNELAPGRFAWRKYPEQINIENVRRHLSFAKDTKMDFLLGSHREGWLLSKKGLKFSKKRVKDLKDTDLFPSPLNSEKILWQCREKTRMLASMAFEKVSNNNTEAITVQDAEAFFRVDDYVTGEKRARKLARIIKNFGHDPDLSKAIKIISKKVEQK